MIKDRPTVTPEFQQAIVNEAFDFATKILILSDPSVQEADARGVEEILEGNTVEYEELRAKFGQH